VDRGCKRIAHLGGADISTALDRLRGYRQALEGRSIAAPPEYVVSRPNSDDKGDIAGYEAMKSLLALMPRPDGVFCYNDPMAMGAMEAALDLGLRVPQDLAIIGCGNVTYARMLRVPLSSVDQNSEGLGEKAAVLALEVAKAKGTLRPQSILLPPSLVARESTAR
jgi:LacI family transcriptional regulator